MLLVAGLLLVLTLSAAPPRRVGLTRVASRFVVREERA